MTRVRVLIVAMLLAMPALAAAQEAKQTNLENTLWDVEQRWLCTGPYEKPYPECVKSRAQYWVEGFYEVQSAGTIRNKEEKREDFSKRSRSLKESIRELERKRQEVISEPLKREGYESPFT